MTLQIKAIFKKIIGVVFGVLIALSAVIFSDFSTTEKIYYFKIILVGLIILVLIYCLHSFFINPNIFKIIKLKMKVKKAIKDLRKGIEYTNLTADDLVYIAQHQNEFENIRDFNILLQHIQDQTRRFAQIIAEAFVGGITQNR